MVKRDAEDADKVVEFKYSHPRASFTVDCVVFGIDYPAAEPAQLQVLLIKRSTPNDAFPGFWALPGGFVNISDEEDQGEDPEDAARRELGEETCIEVGYLEQLYTFGKPKRDPRGRVISLAYFALVRSKDHNAKGADDADEAKWFPMADAAKFASKLAFDHADILQMGLTRLQSKVRYAPLGFNLLPAKFTLTQLQELYEAVLMREIDKRNFRKRFLSMGLLVECGAESEKGKPGPAAKLYRFDKRAYDRLVKQGFNFEV